jgi:hypothetical protein
MREFIAPNVHVLAFDNVSGPPDWLSDALCRLASGGDLAVLEPYSDDAEGLFAPPVAVKHP